MKYILQTAGLAFAISVFIAPFVIKKLKQLKFGQKILEDGPTWHASKQNTPTMGGIIIILAVIITVLSFLPQMQAQGEWRPLLMLALSLVFGAIGFVDDMAKIRKKRNKGITAWQKLMLQIAAGALFITVMHSMGYLSSSFALPFVNLTVTLPWWLFLIFSIFIIVAVDNAVNITDGVDGLCTSVTLIVTIFLSAALTRQGSGGTTFSLALAGALFGFLLFNRFPARVFMGDTGSLFLGGAVCAMVFTYEMPLVLALIGVIYIIEVLSDIIQVLYFKKTGGKRFFKMAPIHHHFEMMGWSEWKIVIVSSVITAAMCVLAWYA